MMKRLSEFFFSALFVLLATAISGLTCPPDLLAQSAAAAIQGSILTEDGKAISDADVLYKRLPRRVQDASGRWADAPNQPHAGSKVAAGANGVFALTGLPEGEYVVCVDAPGFLRSCDWTGWLTVKIAAGERAALPGIRLARAAVLAIRVNDQGRLLPADDRMLRPLVAGVFDEYGAYHAATQVSADDTGRNLEVRIPYSRQMQIWVQSWRFRLAGADGKSIDSKGARTPLRIEPGAASKPFVVTIVGEMPS